MPKWFENYMGLKEHLWVELFHKFGMRNEVWWKDVNLKGKTVVFRGQVEHQLDGEVYVGVLGSKYLPPLNVKELILCLDASIEEKILAKLDDEGKALFEKFIKEKGHE